MRRGLRIFPLAAVPLALSFLIWLALALRDRVVVVGSLPERDLVEIKRVTYSYMVRGQLHHPWQKHLQRLPGVVKYCLSHRIARIEVKTTNTVEVFFSGRRWRDDTGYELQNSTNGVWVITKSFFN
jgi:hypothetical protein